MVTEAQKTYCCWLLASGEVLIVVDRCLEGTRLGYDQLPCVHQSEPGEPPTCATHRYRTLKRYVFGHYPTHSYDLTNHRHPGQSE